MGSIHHILCPDEAAVLACLRDLLRFHDRFDNQLLASAERAIAERCGSSASLIVSQGLFLARILVEDGVLPTRLAPQAAASVERSANPEGLGLLALVEAAQSSRNRLETLLLAAARPTPELVFVMIRFAALLLSAGLRLPRRDALSRLAVPAASLPLRRRPGLHVT